MSNQAEITFEADSILVRQHDVTIKLNERVIRKLIETLSADLEKYQNYLNLLMSHKAKGGE